ncbi:MFS general substrate transporter [Mycena sanguinolenta]|uniref:MFS general substrate transporter n=1 Tax=Mycena sanguinolenta TaxID=230812 RepID=A0A8H6YII6_9AGAR|nr:MFS general substrate transporter [Mycena sanguinolenta]
MSTGVSFCWDGAASQLSTANENRMLIRRLGHLPVLFWSQLLVFGFLVGATFAPKLNTFTAMRCLTAFFGTALQVTGLYIVIDLYFPPPPSSNDIYLTQLFPRPPFFRFLGCVVPSMLLLTKPQLDFWTMGFVISPFLSPFAFGFFVARTSWISAYGIRSMYNAVVMVLILLFMEETCVPLITILVVVECRVAPAYFRVVGVGSDALQVTSAVFLRSPPPVGFAGSELAIAGGYGTPIVSVILGELIGRYMDEFIQNFSIRRNNGVFEAESRKKLSGGAIVMGWELAELSIMINTVAIYAYCNDAFPKHQGEVSALINLARVLGGFAVAYFQVPGRLSTARYKCLASRLHKFLSSLPHFFAPPNQHLSCNRRVLRKEFSLH